MTELTVQDNFRELLEIVKNGEPKQPAYEDAFKKIYDFFKGDVIAILRAGRVKPEDIDDISQKVFLDVFKRRSHLDGRIFDLNTEKDAINVFKSFLATSTKRKVIDLKRKQRTIEHTNISSFYKSGDGENFNGQVMAAISVSDDDLAGVEYANNLLQKFYNAVENMQNSLSKSALELAIIEGLKIEEIERIQSDQEKNLSLDSVVTS